MTIGGLAIVIVSMVAAMVITWRLPVLNLAARDALVRAHGTGAPPDEIVIVAIDDESIKRFGRFPWPRSLMARALDRLSAARPKVIALNVLYADPTDESEDLALTEAIKRSGNAVVAAQLVETPLRGAEWLRPLAGIERAAAGIGHGNVLTDFDGVARSLTIREADDEGRAFWALAVEVVRVGDGLRAGEARDTPEGVMIGPRLIPIAAESPTVKFSAQDEQSSPEIFRADRMMVDYIGPAGAFADRTISIADVVEGRIEPARLQGRYVLIGATAAAMGDRVASPFARLASGPIEQADQGNPRGTLMPGIEVLANAVTTILRSRFYTETPDWIAALVAVLIAVGTLWALSLAQGRYTLLQQLAVMFGMVLLILGCSYLTFTDWLIVPPLVPAMTSFVIAAPLALLLRSLILSASLDERINEMVRESAHLSPLAIRQEPDYAKPPWWPLKGWLGWPGWPLGSVRKSQALAALQQRLLARTQFIDRALQSVEDGLLVTDLTGRITFSNSGAARIFGLSESSLIGGNFFDRLSEAERGAGPPNHEYLERAKTETLSRLLDDRLSVEREVIIRVASPRYYLLRLAVVGDNRDQTLLGIVATLSDITKQRELQMMQNDVMTLVTHEMKTPLTAIKGMSEVLMKFELDTAKRREIQATINEAAERLTRMVDDYLDLTRLESGARQPRQAFHRVESLIERELLLLDPIAASREIRLIRRFAPELPAIMGDGELLACAVTNLVSNAIKYSPARTEVVISAQVRSGDLFIAVADRGSGISLEHRARIFDKFFRVPRAEDADTPGTGLGLALVREIAELHGGRVTVESQIDAGSTFTLILPLRGAGGQAVEPRAGPGSETINLG